MTREVVWALLRHDCMGNGDHSDACEGRLDRQRNRGSGKSALRETEFVRTGLILGKRERPLTY